MTKHRVPLDARQIARQRFSADVEWQIFGVAHEKGASREVVIESALAIVEAPGGYDDIPNSEKDLFRLGEALTAALVARSEIEDVLQSDAETKEKLARFESRTAAPVPQLRKTIFNEDAIAKLRFSRKVEALINSYSGCEDLPARTDLIRAALAMKNGRLPDGYKPPSADFVALSARLREELKHFDFETGELRRYNGLDTYVGTEVLKLRFSSPRQTSQLLKVLLESHTSPMVMY
jgi:hypothetical protein